MTKVIPKFSCLLPSYDKMIFDLIAIKRMSVGFFPSSSLFISTFPTSIVVMPVMSHRLCYLISYGLLPKLSVYGHSPFFFSCDGNVIINLQDCLLLVISCCPSLLVWSRLIPFVIWLVTIELLLSCPSLFPLFHVIVM